MKTFQEYLNEVKKLETSLVLNLDGDKYKKAKQTALDNSVILSNDDENTSKKLIIIHHFEQTLKYEIAKLIAKSDKDIDVYNINVVGSLHFGYKSNKNNDIEFSFTYNIYNGKNKLGEAKISNNKLSIKL